MLPYLASLEVVHRTTTQLLRPGSGKDQRIRLNISGLLLNGEGRRDFAPKLDPESLTVIFDGTPDVILPEQAKHARFGAALNTLSAAGILTVEGRTARIRAPESSELRAEIIRRARSWEAQKEPEIEYVQLRRDVAAAVQRQYDIDREQAGPKAPYDNLKYRGVSLKSRYSVVSEFETMKAVVDAMLHTVRLRLASIWCDSKACAFYHVVVTLGMDHSDLAEQVRQSFLTATSGFNGLSVEHGSHNAHFDSEWPAEDAYLAELEEEQHSRIN